MSMQIFAKVLHLLWPDCEDSAFQFKGMYSFTKFWMINYGIADVICTQKGIYYH